MKINNWAKCIQDPFKQRRRRRRRRKGRGG